jgi:hypothetical protein
MGARSLKRAIAQLRALGLLEIAEHGYHGKYSRYRLAGDLIEPPQRDHSDPVTAEGAHTETLPEGGRTGTLSAEGATQAP